MKGAFKDFPIDQQPERIPLEVYSNLTYAVRAIWGPLFSRFFIPDATKKAFGKSDTGDVDVVFVPKVGMYRDGIQKWRQNILSAYNNIVCFVNNGPQLMIVAKNLLGDNKQYMIDFLLTNEQSYNFKVFFHGHGTIVPALLGSFARSLHYKYTSNNLQTRIRDEKGNYHNCFLTSKVDEFQSIMMLEQIPFGDNRLFTPEGVVDWIVSSPRFDSNVWNTDVSENGISIVVENRKAHTAAKKRPEVQQAYTMLRAINKVSTITNNNFEIERRILGDKQVNKILRKIADQTIKNYSILTGNEIMKILDIKPGPDVGKWIIWLRKQEEFNNLTPEQLTTDTIKDIAKKKLQQAFNEKISI